MDGCTHGCEFCLVGHLVCRRDRRETGRERERGKGIRPGWSGVEWNGVISRKEGGREGREGKGQDKLRGEI